MKEEGGWRGCSVVNALTDSDTTRLLMDDGITEVDKNFYPYNLERKKAADGLYNLAGDLRLPLGLDAWAGMGPGCHIRALFDDGFYYLGIVVYEGESEVLPLFLLLSPPASYSLLSTALNLSSPSSLTVC
eukprot:217700-Hanusia_phi.AAC.1